MSCPEASVLARYHEQKLPDGVARPIAVHVSGCSHCKRRLKRLDDLVDADEATVAGNPGSMATRGGSEDGQEDGRSGGTEGDPEQARVPYLEKDARVGRYVIREVIGVGGMGAVYAAHDPELNRRVALKVLRARKPADAPNSEGHSRLMREAQALARLSHPNIVTVYDVGSFEGEIYIAMELVDGTTLTDWLKKAPRPWKDVARVFVLAGRGLAAAHAASLVHRDFKPDNVLVGRDGRVRVMDFGLARPAGGPEGEEEEDSEPSYTDPSVERSFLKSPLTRKGIIVGTPMYMAPEQFLNEPIDSRSDQFSFCVALYEALYGHLPFEGDTVEDLAHAIVAARLPALPPSRRVPLAVHRVLRRGMRSEPKDRYPGMDSLLRSLEFGINFRTRASALAAAAAVATVVAVVNPFESAEKLCPDPMSELAGVWDGPRQALTEAAFKKTGARFAKDTFHSVRQTLDDYAQDWAQAKREACLATRVRREQSEQILELRNGCLDRRRRELDELVGLFLNADADVLQRSVHAAFALSAVAGCADLAALAAPPSGPEQAEIRTKVSEQRAKLAAAAARRHAGKYKEALAIAGEVTAAARELKFRPLEAEALSLRGRLEEETGDYKAAEQTLLDATTAASAARLHSLAARSLVDLALVVGHRQGRTAEAQQFGQLASGLIEGLGSPDELNAGKQETLGLVSWRAGDYAAASSYARRVLELREKVHGQGSLEVAKALKQLGVAYSSLGRLEEALACLERAIPIQEKLLGADHPEVALTLNNLGYTLVNMSQFGKADAAFARSLAIYEAAFGATSPTLGPFLNNIGMSLTTQGRYDEALQHLNRALEITEKAVGRESPRVPPMLNNIAEALLRQGKPAEALSRYELALAVREKTQGKNHVNLANELTGMGVAYLSLGKPELAVQPLERALKLREQSPGYPGKLADTRFALARALWATGGDRERALLLATSARDGKTGSDPLEKQERADIAQWIRRHEQK